MSIANCPADENKQIKNSRKRGELRSGARLATGAVTVGVV
jgi:hypothetical protein